MRDSKGQRINSLQGLRAILFVLIFSFHTSMIRNISESSIYLNFIKGGGGTEAVAFFFVLSGFVEALHQRKEVPSIKKIRRLCIAKVKKFYGVHVFFLLAVIPFRSIAGGWHAKEFWQCAILSNLMIVIMLICIEKLCITKEIVYVIFEVITLLALIFIIPTQNPNKKLSQNELKKYKKVSFIIWLVQCCLLVVFFVYKSYQFSTIMLYTHIIIVIAAVAQTMSEIKSR